MKNLLPIVAVLAVISIGCTELMSTLEPQPIRHMIQRDVNGDIVKSSQMSDVELGEAYAGGIKFVFRNTDIQNQEGLEYIESFLLNLEADVGFDPFVDDYTIEIHGASYNPGVVPVIVDFDGETAIIQLPNHIDMIRVIPEEGSWMDSIGDIYIKDIDGYFTIKIDFSQ